jgi:hypothetical protein
LIWEFVEPFEPYHQQSLEAPRKCSPSAKGSGVTMIKTCVITSYDNYLGCDTEITTKNRNKDKEQRYKRTRKNSVTRFAAEGGKWILVLSKPQRHPSAYFNWQKSYVAARLESKTIIKIICKLTFCTSDFLRVQKEKLFRILWPLKLQLQIMSGVQTGAMMLNDACT